MTDGPTEEVDAAAFAALRALLAPRDFARAVTAAAADVERACADLEGSIAAAQDDAMRSAAHRLAGVLAQYACPSAAEAARRLSGAPNRADAAAVCARARICARELRMSV